MFDKQWPFLRHISSHLMVTWHALHLMKICIRFWQKIPSRLFNCTTWNFYLHSLILHNVSICIFLIYQMTSTDAHCLFLQFKRLRNNKVKLNFEPVMISDNLSFSFNNLNHILQRGWIILVEKEMRHSTTLNITPWRNKKREKKNK